MICKNFSIAREKYVYFFAMEEKHPLPEKVLWCERQAWKNTILKFPKQNIMFPISLNLIAYKQMLISFWQMLYYFFIESPALVT